MKRKEVMVDSVERDAWIFCLLDTYADGLEMRDARGAKFVREAIAAIRNEAAKDPTRTVPVE